MRSPTEHSGLSRAFSILFPVLNTDGGGDAGNRNNYCLRWRSEGLKRLKITSKMICLARTGEGEGGGKRPFLRLRAHPCG